MRPPRSLVPSSLRRQLRPLVRALFRRLDEVLPRPKGWKKALQHIPPMLRLRLRWRLASGRVRRRLHDERSPLRPTRGLDRCDVVYINLDKRSDRRAEIENELGHLGVHHARRFSAIEMESGALGCAMWHRDVLESWDSTERDLLLVCEDDCLFLVDRDTIDAAIDEFADDPRLDVMTLAYSIAWSVPISTRLSIATGIETMACYVIKRRSVTDLELSARESVSRLRGGDLSAAIDLVWKPVQQRLFFAVPRQRMAKQRASFSDIRGAPTDYSF